MTEPFRPSNATQGDGFMAEFCEQCLLAEACDIPHFAMMYQIGDPMYPPEWIINDKNAAECTAFEAINKGENHAMAAD